MSLGERADKDGCSGRSRCCWNRVTLSCIRTCCLWTVGRPRGLSACPLCLARRQSWEAKRSMRGRRFLKCFSQLQEKSYKYQTSIHQKYRIERVIIDLLWRWRCQQFYRRLFCNRSLWRKGFFGLFSNAGSQMSVGHSLDTQKSPRMTFSFGPFLLRHHSLYVLTPISVRLQGFLSSSVPPSTLFFWSHSSSDGLFLAAGAPLGSHFTFIIKVMLRLPFSPSLPLSLSTDNKSCRRVSLQASCHIVCPYCFRVPVAADPGSQFISI